MSVHMILNGFGFSGYRSFGEELTKIAPLKKVNLIIGRNNIGKSNIINFLNEEYIPWLHNCRGTYQQYASTNTVSAFKQTSKYLSNPNAKHRIAFPVFKDDIEDFILSIKFAVEQNRHLLTKLVNSLVDENGDLWFSYSSINPRSKFNPELMDSIDEIERVLQPLEWNSLWSSITGSNGGNKKRHWIPQVLEKLQCFPENPPPIEVIPAIRKVGGRGSVANDFSGEGIIERLAKIQNPPLQKLEDKRKFLAINEFVQDVLGNATAKIEIPYERDMILVHMDDKTLPLESLGTGVHEVIILAAASTILTKTVICVEEPELHLHPLLQKKLVAYLADKTDNQYFFTTHSAHLLDAVEAEIFHVTQNEGTSYVQAIASTKERSSICNDLGYKASDLLQANCIIWVEGPSDRIYLNYWIKSKKPELIEGLHYSIMFYGGRLFSHLSALDKEEQTELLQDFISVRSLNRNTVIMFDSDKSNPHSHLNATKKRLKEEFDDGCGFAWVTKGREVENYLDYDELEKSVLRVHKSATSLIEKTEWSNLLKYRKSRGAEDKTANKVKVANDYISNNEPDFSKLDLDVRVNQLCTFICTCNGI